MAKKKLPSVGEETVFENVEPAKDAAPPRKRVKRKTVSNSVTITVPLGSAPNSASYQDCAYKVDSQRLTRKQRANLVKMRRGLEDAQTRLEDGRLVVGNAAVIRWLLEQV